MVRRTLASATVGFDEHNENGAEGGSQQHHATVSTRTSILKSRQLWMGRGAYDSFEGLRDVVDEVVDVSMERLDRENSLSNRGTLLDVNKEIHLDDHH